MTRSSSRVAALAVLMAPLAAHSAQGWFTSPDRQGLRAFEGRDFGHAAELFADPAWRAASLHRQGRYLESAAVLRELATAPARYNRATALALGGEIETAIRLYEAGQQAHKSGLAAAAGADNGQELARFDVEGQVDEGIDLTVRAPAGAAAEGLGKRIDRQ